MILSLFPVSNRKLPFGCMTTKKPTGIWTCVLGAPDWSALLAIVSGPELNAYIFMPAGGRCCANAESTVPASRSTTANGTTERFIFPSRVRTEPLEAAADDDRTGGRLLSPVEA